MQIHHAASRGDHQALNRQLRAGVPVDAADPGGQTPLMCAAESGRGTVSTLKLLIDAGADVNAVSSQLQQTLMSAAEQGRAKVMQLLVSVGANVEAADDTGRTALFYAAAPEGFTAFRLMQEAASPDWPLLSEELDPSVAEALRQSSEILNSMATPPARPDYGYQPSDDVGAIEFLIQAGANLEARDDEGLTALLLAAGCGRPSRVAALSRLHANTHACDAAGRTAAQQVASHHDPDQAAEILRILR